MQAASLDITYTCTLILQLTGTRIVMPTRSGLPPQIAPDQLGWASVTKGVLILAVLLQLCLVLQLQPVQQQRLRNNAFFSTPDTRIRHIAAYVRRISSADNQPGFTLLVSRDDQVLYTGNISMAIIFSRRPTPVTTCETSTPLTKEPALPPCRIGTPYRWCGNRPFRHCVSPRLNRRY